MSWGLYISPKPIFPPLLKDILSPSHDAPKFIPHAPLLAFFLPLLNLFYALYCNSPFIFLIFCLFSLFLHIFLFFLLPFHIFPQMTSSNIPPSPGAGGIFQNPSSSKYVREINFTRPLTLLYKRSS